MAAEGDIDLVVLNTFFTGPAMGVLVEVGAARPDYLSISANFRARGWKIVAIEPNPEFCAAHRARGHEVLEYACSDEDSDNADFLIVDSKSARYMNGNISFESFSSLGIKDEFAELYETVEADIKSIHVKVRRLDNILASHEPDIREIDVLAVDVEGWELNVIRGLTLDKYKPKIVILENLFRRKDYMQHMQGCGYELWLRLEPNDIYVRRELMDYRVRIRGFIRTILGPMRARLGFMLRQRRRLANY